MHDRLRRGAYGVDILNTSEGDEIVVPGPAPRIAIASPYDVWSAGLEAILEREGWRPCGRWTSDSAALAGGGLADADVLVLAKRLVDRPAGGGPYRPCEADYDGKIVVVIEPSDLFTAEDFVALDVEGLILGAATLDDVVACFDSVRQGRRWVDPGIRALLGQTQRPLTNAIELSSREQQVARMAAAGLSNKRIARALNLSDGTVKMHMHHILAKLRLNSRFDLMGAPLGLVSGTA